MIETQHEYEYIEELNIKIPKGWKLVPREPTKRMINAGSIVDLRFKDYVWRIYRMMLDYSPDYLDIPNDAHSKETRQQPEQ